MRRSESGAVAAGPAGRTANGCRMIFLTVVCNGQNLSREYHHPGSPPNSMRNTRRAGRRGQPRRRTLSGRPKTTSCFGANPFVAHIWGRQRKVGVVFGRPLTDTCAVNAREQPTGVLFFRPPVGRLRSFAAQTPTGRRSYILSSAGQGGFLPSGIHQSAQLTKHHTTGTQWFSTKWHHVAARWPCIVRWAIVISAISSVRLSVLRPI